MHLPIKRLQTEPGPEAASGSQGAARLQPDAVCSQGPEQSLSAGDKRGSQQPPEGADQSRQPPFSWSSSYCGWFETGLWLWLFAAWGHRPRPGEPRDIGAVLYRKTEPRFCGGCWRNYFRLCLPVLLCFTLAPFLSLLCAFLTLRGFSSPAPPWHPPGHLPTPRRSTNWSHSESGT